MKWIAPDYTEVLEQRLREARLDLMADPRLTRKQGEGLSPEFLARLVREKIAAAARYGYEGIESSLRLDAQDILLARGKNIEETRALLDAAATQLLPPSPPPYELQPAGWGANVLSATVFAAWTIASVLLHSIFWFHPLLLVCLIGLGGIPAVMVRNWRLLDTASISDRLLREYPSDLCRHYVESLRKQVAEYEQKVNAAGAARPETAGVR